MRITVPILFFLLFYGMNAAAQSPEGLWITIDDTRKVEIAVVEIYEEEDQLYGKVLQLLPDALTRTCVRCPGELRGKHLEGIVLVRDLKNNNGQWSGGKLLDPKSGREYDCSLWLENDTTLKIRASIGFSFLGRTQTWRRKK